MLTRIKRAWSVLTEPKVKYPVEVVTQPMGLPLETAAARQPLEAERNNIAGAILESLKAQGIIPPQASLRVTQIDTKTGKVVDVSESATAASAPRPIGPHSTPEEIEAERKRREGSWKFWQDMMKGELAAAPPDWAMCRIGNRHQFSQDDMGWVYGIAKGPFGLWATIYHVCDADEDTSDGKLLWAVTNIPTGLGFGLFADLATAIEACNTLMPIVDWRAQPAADFTMASQKVWHDLVTRSHTHWEFVGIERSRAMHCHIEHEIHPIWVKPEPQPGETLPRKDLNS